MLPVHKLKLGLDFHGLAWFILFLIALAVGLIWVVYTLAPVIVPAAFIVFAGLVAFFIPYHLWSRATITARSTRRIEGCLAELRNMEQLGMHREQVRPLERRTREAAQTLADSAYMRLRRLSRQNERERRRRERGGEVRQRSAKRWQDRLKREQALVRELEYLQTTHDVLPEHDPWRRFFHLHLERDGIRWMIEHPRPTRYIVTAVLIVLVTAVVSVQP